MTEIIENHIKVEGRQFCDEEGPCGMLSYAIELGIVLHKNTPDGVFIGFATKLKKWDIPCYLQAFYCPLCGEEFNKAGSGFTLTYEGDKNGQH